MGEKRKRRREGWREDKGEENGTKGRKTKKLLRSCDTAVLYGRESEDDD